MPDAAYRLAAQPRVPGRRRADAAFVHAGRTVTFDDLDRRAAAFCAGAREAGLRPGDRVMLLLRNTPEVFELLVGCARAGLVAVPVNWRLAEPEARAVAADSAARAVIVDSSLVHRLPGVIADLDPILVLQLGQQYESWLSQSRGRRDRDDLSDRDDDPAGADTVVLQVYTSGTSGQPKGVLITNRNLAAKVPGVTPLWGLDAGSKSLLVTPLFHVGALSWGLAGLQAGATTVLAGDASPETVLRHLADDRISHTFLVPAMITALCATAVPGVSFPDLRVILYGASPIAPTDQAAARRIFGPVLHQLYGMTETTGAFTQMPADPRLPADSPLLRSVGRPYPWVQVQVRHPETGTPLPAGEVGEVWTRSAQNCAGYAGRPQETRDLLTGDGWLRTGDGGYLDTDGLLFLTDRVKEMVISGGENVYPAEVEAVLLRHPGVAEVAVFGIPDGRWGERVAAAVVPRPGSTPAPQELVEFTADLLAGYKRPRTVVLVPELPRNPTGKVLRRRLQEQYT